MNGIIYCAKAPDGQMYIGKTIKTLEERKIGHKTTAKTSGSMLGIRGAINKFGFDNIEWYIIEDEIKSELKLSKKETHYIQEFDTFNNGLNLTEKSSGAPGGKNHPMFGKIGKKNPRYGKKHTDESKRKMSKSQPIKKLSDNSNARPVEIDEIKFGCIIDAAKHFGVVNVTIRRWLNGGHRGRRKGKHNSNARPVEIDEIKFGCIIDAAKHFGVVRGTIQGWLNGGNGSKNHKAKYL